MSVATATYPRISTPVPGDMTLYGSAPAGTQTNRAGVLVHQVLRGDTLSGIAHDYNQAFGLKTTWSAIYDANRGAIGSNPNRIQPGQQLKIPGLQRRAASIIAHTPGLKIMETSPGGFARLEHVVQRGDTLTKIAQEYNSTASFGTHLTYRDVYNANRETIGTNPNVIKVGQELLIPSVSYGPEAP